MANASCLIPLCTVNDQLSIMLIKRSAKTVYKDRLIKSNIFQYSWPGGGQEPEDHGDLWHTTVREVQEEIPGLKSRQIDRWGETLPPLCDPPIRYRVFTHVGFLGDFEREEIER